MLIVLSGLVKFSLATEIVKVIEINLKPVSEQIDHGDS